MGQFLLLIFVTFSGQSPMVYLLSGQFSYNDCRAQIPGKVQEARVKYPSATVTGQCLQMVPT